MERMKTRGTKKDMVGEESRGIFTPIEAGDYFGRENEKKERTRLEDGRLNSSQEDSFVSPREQTPMPSDDEEEVEVLNPQELSKEIASKSFQNIHSESGNMNLTIVQMGTKLAGVRGNTIKPMLEEMHGLVREAKNGGKQGHMDSTGIQRYREDGKAGEVDVLVCSRESGEKRAVSPGEV